MSMLPDSLGDYRIVKSNEFINQRSGFSLIQQRAIQLAIAQIMPDDDDLKPRKILIRDVLGLQKGDRISGAQYRNVREQIMQLTKTSIDLINDPNDDESGFDSISFIERVRKYEGKNYVVVEFSQSVKPFLIKLNKNFTTYSLKWVFDFEHVYSLRIYELCKQYERIGQRVMTVKYLRALLLIEDKYRDFSLLRKKVLDPAIKEINTLSDIRVDYEPIKRGRAYAELRFSVKSVALTSKNKQGENVAEATGGPMDRKPKKSRSARTMATAKSEKKKPRKAEAQPESPALEFSWDVGPETQPTEEELRQKYLADYERYYQEVRTDYLRRATREQKNAFQAHVHENGTIPERNCLERLVSGKADRTDWNMFATFVIRTQGADQDRRYLDPQAYVQDRLEEHNRKA
ncbi:hypothetical protein FUAX_55340 (plasmid) [Fulvitalea axinellae]|uniref:Initiator Rep protein WH1 domain-containing protein n=1 Tax=Fulvitalea axinellae TaxID=1182444 RepID=A0AAU9D6T4_9BACT|nr:hypothetical protein FUAX_55340 [Fulvitalea axinellae]